MYNQNSSPVDFGRVISRGWDLSIRTLPNAGVLLLAVYLPLTVIIGMLTRNLFFAIAELARTPGALDQNDPQVMTHILLPMIGSYLSIGLASLFCQFLIPYVSTAALIASWEGANAHDIPISDLLRRSLRRPFWYILVQGILVGMIVMAAYFLVSILGFLLAIISGGIGVVVIPIVMLAGLIYFATATAFSRHEIVASERGPMKSLITSMRLVKGNWFRVFSLLALLMIAANILLLPIAIPVFVKVIHVMQDLPTYSKNDPRVMIDLFNAFSGFFSPWLMAVLGILSAVTVHFSTNFLTSLYAELRAGHDALQLQDEWGADPVGAPGT